MKTAPRDLEEQLHCKQHNNHDSTDTSPVEEEGPYTTTTTPTETRKASLSLDELRKPLKTIEKRMKKKGTQKTSAAMEMMRRERRPSIDWAFWWSAAARSACMPPAVKNEGEEGAFNTPDRRVEPSGAVQWTAKQLDHIINNSPFFVPEYPAQRLR
ncbi:uncharacterized protein ACA1_077210 [Acanthamoeba castellanii str. Neff]|uniref:Uncharacterized protein n=1 Tax=Acanthamoeba castellanii (strain ATCC 30010 / Neff) TaxID=1257118 RepID=L8GLF1_ACACF|nr:uncharacterized protein ACA1_077210 [Acanthamoeba castellanii str. Neff]ELR13867.1 hypothetical protein ACA1_077210 [Acanthamoeba castellanii str. Neff]